MQETYSISELGKEFGISTRAIRFYEDKQLLCPARDGQRRIYSRADRTRLQLLLRGKRLGWPLEEIKTVLDMYESGDQGELLQLEYTCRKIEESMQQLRQQQKDINASLADLRQIQDRCKTRIDRITAADDNSKPVAGPSSQPVSTLEEIHHAKR